MRASDVCCIILAAAPLAAGESAGNKSVANGAAIVVPGTWNGQAVFVPRPKPNPPAPRRSRNRPDHPRTQPQTRTNAAQPESDTRKSKGYQGAHRPILPPPADDGEAPELDPALEIDLTLETLLDNEETEERQETVDRTMELRAPARHGPVNLRLPDGDLLTVRPGALVQLKGRRYTVVGRTGGRLILRERGTGKLRKLRARMTRHGEVFIARPTRRTVPPTAEDLSPLDRLPPQPAGEVPR